MKKAASLRTRLVLVATIVLLTTLGAVGLALDAANQRSVVATLQSRMESYVFLVLAAMEVGPDGVLQVSEDFEDPRLSQPGSGLYLQVEDNSTAWQSASALGQTLPELDLLSPGQKRFSTPESTGSHFIYGHGIGWEMSIDEILPFTVSVLMDSSEIDEPVAAFRSGLWRWLAAVAAVLAVVQGFLFMVAFRPFRKIAEDVANIESGHSPRLEGEYSREIEPLARNVNRLLDSEQANQQSVRNALDSLAHSLKTPLAVIQAALPAVPAKPRDTLQAAVDDMNHLVSTRLERAGASARRALAGPVPVKPQVERIIESLGKIYSQKMISVSHTLEDNLVFYGEKRDLLEMMGNLLDNGFKYGRKSVRVEGGVTDASEARTGLWMRVEDDGPGIPPELRERLVQRGVRGDERAEGHGLGLAIVLELVTAYGGTVEIEDSAMGGASITIRVPGS